MSTIDELRARREALKSRDRHLDYEVPGYEGDLVVRFDPMSYGTLVRYQVAVARVGFGLQDIDDEAAAELLKLDADALVKSCRAIYVKAEDGTVESEQLGCKLAPIVDGQATTFADVDEPLGFEADTAIEAVHGVFEDDRELGACAAAVKMWTERASVEADAALGKELGEE